MHQLHPLVHKGRFSKQEDAALLKPHGTGSLTSFLGPRLCSLHQGYDWEAVSRHFVTSRTPWRLFKRYQRALNNGIVREGWCLEHLERLRRAVEELGYFVDGQEVRSQYTVMARIGEGRSAEQINNVFHRR